MKRSCRNCLFYGLCDTSKIGKCAYFAPVEEDTDIDRRVEAARDEFRRAWMIYIEEDD